MAVSDARPHKHLKEIYKMSFGNSMEGSLSVNGTSTAGVAGTTEQTLMTYSLPVRAFNRAGQRLRIRGQFETGANGNTKTFKLYFGASSISSGAITTNAKGGYLELDVIYLTSATQTVLGRGQSDATALSTATTAGTDDCSAAVVIKLTGTGGTSGVDCIAKAMVVELCQEA